STCKGSQPERKRLHTGAVRAFLLHLLADRCGVDGAPELPDAIRSYLDAAGDDLDARDLHRFQFAGRWSRLFHQYSEVRPGLLRDWRSGRADFDGTELSATENWQRWLWDGLLGLLAQVLRDQGTHWILPIDLLATVREGGVELP